MDKLEQNIIIVVSPIEVSPLSVYLAPKQDPQDVWRKMALPAHHVYSFNMTTARPDPVGNVPFSPCYWLIPESHRFPTMRLDGLEKQFRTWFLGQAEDTINDNVRDITELLERVKRDTLTSTFRK